MKTIAILILGICFNLSVFAQNHKTIRSKFMAMNLWTSSNTTKQYWEEIHPLHGGGEFICDFLGDNKIKLTYGKSTPQVITKYKDDQIGKLKNVIARIDGFKLFGIYQDETYPVYMFYYIYLDTKTEKDILIQIRINSGGSSFVDGAMYYTNGKRNPFRKKPMLEKTPERIKVNMTGVQTF
jgi:hypothetical protein